MKIATAFLLLVTLSASAASSPWVVKITSGRCEDTNPFHGSGMLFQVGGQPYVITSDHVVLHENKGFCHAVWSPQLKREYSAEFITSEWGNGLALLSVDNLKTDASWPQLSDLSQPSPAVNQPVVVTGFASSSKSDVNDTRGHIEDLNRDPVLFAFVDKMDYVTGAHGEFGMSGSPLLDANLRFLGVLSHQFVEGEIKDDLYVIPGSVVFAWLTSYFASPAVFKPVFFQLAFDQPQADNLVVGSGNLDYSVTCLKKSSDCHAYLGLNRYRNTRSFQDATGAMARTVTYLKSHIGSGGSAEIAYFRRGLAPETTPTYLPFTSLVQFVRMLKDPSLTPLIMTRGGGNDADFGKFSDEITSELRSTQQDLCEKGQGNLAGQLLDALQNLTVFLGQRVPGTNPSDPYNFLTYGEQSIPIGTIDVERVLQGPTFSSDWQQLDGAVPEDSQHLKTSLQKLDYALDDYTI